MRSNARGDTQLCDFFISAPDGGECRFHLLVALPSEKAFTAQRRCTAELVLCGVQRRKVIEHTVVSSGSYGPLTTSCNPQSRQPGMCNDCLGCNNAKGIFTLVPYVFCVYGKGQERGVSDTSQAQWLIQSWLLLTNAGYFRHSSSSQHLCWVETQKFILLLRLPFGYYSTVIIKPLNKVMHQLTTKTVISYNS